MKKACKSFFRVVFSRTFIVFLSLLLQIGILFSCFYWLEDYHIITTGTYVLITAITIIYIINEDSNPSFKLAWIVPVLVFPILGVFLYIFIKLQIGTKLIAARLRTMRIQTKPYLDQEPDVIHSLEAESSNLVNLAQYVKSTCGFPIYQNTQATYFPIGEDKFTELVKQLKQAKHYIFMEYFIVDEGFMWNTILDILSQKVKEGVEVRFLYDGMCCLMLLPYNYPKKLEAMGIKCKMFAPIKPALSTYQNNRDHRKITVIDGHTAFTGGVNLADEYINQKVRFGHWKDVAIMLKGDAVKSFTLMFLQMWNITEKTTEDYEKYLSIAEHYPVPLSDGYVMPYCDSPVDNENTAKDVYLDILYQAKKYVHIMTPYLILDNELITALVHTAKSGVDVKIIMPHIPDKKYAFYLAKTYYPRLIRAGVKIYEYTPGFVHAKVFVSDHTTASVGTINLDYRSLYLHYECSAYLYQNSAIADIEKDFQETLDKCQEITIEDCKKLNVFVRLAGRLLRLVAPLM